MLTIIQTYVQIGLLALLILLALGVKIGRGAHKGLAIFAALLVITELVLGSILLIPLFWKKEISTGLNIYAIFVYIFDLLQAFCLAGSTVEAMTKKTMICKAESYAPQALFAIYFVMILILKSQVPLAIF